MKRKIGLILALGVGLILTGCSTAGGEDISNPIPLSELYPDTTVVSFTNGETITCYSNDLSTKYAEMVCDWRGLQHFQELKVSPEFENEYKLHFVQEGNEVIPCLNINEGTEYATSSCGFGAIKR